MSSLIKEISKNCNEFSKDWPETLATSISALEKTSGTSKIKEESYRRLTSLQAWRTYVLEPSLNEEPLAFFLEAQNDALVSHVNAFMGASRVALQSLRSVIENVLYMIYYMDHPVELRMWAEGKHRMQFSKLAEYVNMHPDFFRDKTQKSISGIELLRAEYAQLSAAVHGSSKSFRMTDEGNMPALWNSSKTRLNQWRTREKNTLLAVNLVLLNLFRARLQGTAAPQLRSSLAFSIPKTMDGRLKKHFGVKLKR